MLLARIAVSDSGFALRRRVISIRASVNCYSPEAIAVLGATFSLDLQERYRLDSIPNEYRKDLLRLCNDSANCRHVIRTLLSTSETIAVVAAVMCDPSEASYYLNNCFIKSQPRVALPFDLKPAATSDSGENVKRFLKESTP